MPAVGNAGRGESAACMQSSVGGSGETSPICNQKVTLMTNSSDTSMSNERPKVAVRAQTANTCEILIKTESGDVRIVASHKRIFVQADTASMLEVEVQP